jgi:hypothetical protein
MDCVSASLRLLKLTLQHSKDILMGEGFIFGCFNLIMNVSPLFI